MKEKIKVIVVIIGILAALIILWLSGRNVKFLEDVEVSDIDTIVLEVAGYRTVTDQEDIEKIVEKLQAMEFDRTYTKSKSGWGIVVNIYYKDGSDNVFIFYEDDVSIDGKSYNCDSSYCDELKAMYEGFDEKYPLEQ